MFNKDEIYNYIEKKHLEDGGYFFAEVVPSSGLDTYLAVKTLNILGFKPRKPEAIISFWKNEEYDGNLDDLNGLFFAYQCHKILGYSLKNFDKYKNLLLTKYQDPELYKKRQVSLAKDEFSLASSSVATVYIDILEGEAKSIYYLITLLTELGISFDKRKFIKYVNSLQNDDGGFGGINGSQTATTLYCLEILNKIEHPFPKEKEIRQYLMHQFLLANYLEEYYWTIEGLALLKREIPDKKKILSFICACYRGNGGFSRSQFMGISTIEYTYYAVSILKQLEKQYISVFNNKS